jgi:glycine betaine/choline ABC-type transport system substrate-binding protein
MKNLIYGILAAGLLVSSCHSKGTVTLGSLKTNDALTISEIYALVLEKAGHRVVRSYNFDDGRALRAAILDGTVDIGTEWTGAALTKGLSAPRAGDQYGVYDALAARYKALGLALLEPLPADNHWTLAVLQKTAASKGLKTFSDVKNKAPELAIAVTAEFNNDSEGFPLLEEIYGAFAFKEIKIATEEEQHQLLLSNTVDIITLRANDGHFSDANYTALRDNFHAFVPQNLVPVVKDEYLSSHAEIRSALNAVSASLNDKAMILLNNKTSVKKIPYPQTAKEYLKEQR